MSNVVNIKYFAALPGRAIRDNDLTGLQLRVLAAIAGHDRMGRNGQACWAGRKAMAERVGCSETHFSDAISALVKAGYIEVEKHETDGRRKGYSVVYKTDEDAAGIGVKSRENGSVAADVYCGNKSAQGDASEGIRSVATDVPSFHEHKKGQVNQLIAASVRKPNIFPERENNIPLKRENTRDQKVEAPRNPKMEILKFWYEPDERHDMWSGWMNKLAPYQWQALIGLWKKGSLLHEHRQLAEDGRFAELIELRKAVA